MDYRKKGALSLTSLPEDLEEKGLLSGVWLGKMGSMCYAIHTAKPLEICRKHGKSVMGKNKWPGGSRVTTPFFGIWTLTITT